MAVSRTLLIALALAWAPPLFAQHGEYFAALKKMLAPGGRVAIIDVRLDSSAGPPKQHRIAQEKIGE